MRIEDSAQQQLELPASEKARLLHELVHSLGHATQAEIDAIWLDEAGRRDHDMQQSCEDGIDGVAALQRIRARLSEV